MNSAPDERWVSAVGFSGRYEVSDRGRIRSSTYRVSCGQHGGTRVIPGRLLRGRKPNPYVRVALTGLDGKCIDKRVHVLVLEAFVGPRPTGMDACHNDGDPLNNMLSNLRWGTRSDNILDIVRHGRHAQTTKATCPRRHRLEPSNLTKLFDSHGWRECRACAETRWANRDETLTPEAFDREADRRYIDLTGWTS